MIPINSTIIEILVVAVIYISIAITAQRKLSNVAAVYEIQDQMQQKSRELSEMAKSNADKALLMQKQQEISQLLGQSMKNSFKPMLVVLPMFFLTYYVLLPAGFANAPFPQFSILSVNMTYQNLFFYTVFILGLVISISLSFRDKANLRKSRMTAGAPAYPTTSTGGIPEADSD